MLFRSGQKPSVPTAGVGVSETGAVAPVTPVSTGTTGGAKAQPGALKDTLTVLAKSALTQYEQDKNDPNYQQKIDTHINEMLAEAGYKPLTAEQSARGRLLNYLGRLVKNEGIKLTKTQKPKLPELEAHKVYGPDFIDDLHKGNAALKALGIQEMTDDELRRYTYARFGGMHLNDGDYPHAKGHKLPNPPAPPTVAIPPVQVTPPAAPKKPRAKKAVIPIVPKEQQDLGEQRNAMREKARAAYSAGDLTPSQYALISNLLSKGELEPVQDRKSTRLNSSH